MWQRIQTLYLAISTVLLAVLLFGTACMEVTPDGVTEVSYLHLKAPYIGILIGIIAAMTVLALVAFKVRILQMRLSVLSGLVALGLQVWLGVLYFTAPATVTFRWTVIFPLAVAVFNFLAARGCFQDQLMVESASRIRNKRH